MCGATPNEAVVRTGRTLFLFLKNTWKSTTSSVEYSSSRFRTLAVRTSAWSLTVAPACCGTKVPTVPFDQVS